MSVMAQIRRSYVGLSRQSSWPTSQLEDLSIRASFGNVWLLGFWPGNSQQWELCILTWVEHPSVPGFCVRGH